MRFAHALWPLLWLPVQVLSGATIGVASDWSAFVFSGINLTNGSSGGGLAAGNSLLLSNVQIADLLPANNTSVQILSAGSVDLGAGFANGSIQYATTGSSSISRPAAATFSQAPSPFDFAMLKAMYQNYSSALGSLAPNGTAAFAFGTLTLEGSDPMRNVFTIAPGLLGSGTSSVVLRIPTGSTAIINVQGTSVSYENAGFDASFGSTPSSRILWNLPEATSFTSSGVALGGSLLAPRSEVTLANGGLGGQLVADSLSAGSYRFGFEKFDGDIPPLAPVPEPATFLLAGGAVALAVAIRVRSGR